MAKYDIEEIREKHKGRKLVILANGPSAMDRVDTKGVDKALIQQMEIDRLGYVDMSDVTDNLWTMNGAWYYHPNSTLGFNMDDVSTVIPDGNHPQGEWFMSLMDKSNIPIMTTTEYEEYSDLVAYPIKEVIRYHNMAYFAESLNYMLAFAIYCEVSEIELHGADYTDDHECPWERASNEFWLGVAHGKGIVIKIPAISKLLKHSDNRKGELDRFVEGFYGYLKTNFPLERDEHGSLLLDD